MRNNSAIGDGVLVTPDAKWHVNFALPLTVGETTPFLEYTDSSLHHFREVYENPLCEALAVLLVCPADAARSTAVGLTERRWNLELPGPATLSPVIPLPQLIFLRVTVRCVSLHVREACDGA